MALTIRLPEDLDSRLGVLAEAEHVSKTSLLIQGAELVLARHERAQKVDAGIDFIVHRDAGLLERLADA